MDVPTDEDGLIVYVIEHFTAQGEEYKKLLEREYSKCDYPDRKTVEAAVSLCGTLLSQRKDNLALLKKMQSMEDDLLDSADDISQVMSFFKNQRVIFDNAKKLISDIENEKDYFQAETEALRSISAIRDILELPRPYKKISELPGLCQNVQNVYAELLAEKRSEIITEIQAAMAELHQSAGIDRQDIIRRADNALDMKKASAKAAEKLTSLDAMKIQIDNIRRQYMKQLLVIESPNVDLVTMNRNSICIPKKLENEQDVDAYLAQIKKRIMEQLEGHDVLQII